MALKTERIYYTSRNFRTGLADVTARIRKDGVNVASGVALTEVDSVNQPGVYVLTLSPATITGYGGVGLYEFYINSVTKDAPAVTAKYINASNTDDLETHLSAVEVKIDDVQTKVTANKATLESGTFGLAALKSLIDSVQAAVSTIQNNTNFSAAILPESIKPGSGTNTYRVPINVYDTQGNMEDPDSNQILVSITNEAGTDRSSYLAGYVSGPVAATRDAQGQYRIDYSIPDTAPEEMLIFKFDYQEGAVQRIQTRTSEVILEVQPAGFALELTAQDILTDTADMQPRVSDIQTKINSATFGLSALKDLIDILDTNVDSIKATVENATYGLANLKTVLDTKASQVSVDGIQTDVTAVKGASFDTGTDSLKAISDRVYTGGKAI